MSTSGRTDSSRSTGNSSRKDRNLFAEIEMASREQYGYWRASLTARIPPAAAVCGCSILTSRLSSRQAKNIDTTSRGDVVEDAYLLCQTLDESSTPEEALQTLHAQSASIDVLVIALQASIEAAQLSTVPVKIAASMYEKTFEAKSKPKKREALFPSLIKLLRKIPQDTLVVLMFLLTIAQRLQAKGITIDDREPALFLLRSLLPTSLALSPDHFAGDSVSRLLAIHFDEIPGDMPLVLESVNHRFAAGKKVNLLSLISGQSGKAQRQSQKPGPGGVREIEGAEDKEIQW
ncbi:hypothetical protein AC578_8222 [Pseudocercospora eumusae]|uniref:Rho-GAP domain-containing protein n=1 Tax=Pseudocercospora eumusae TaxID=321146 RepID=A0A139HE29_9PEZI|nr:hypothetical protein AC578_8222 [Pseudocercospora eumusae]